MTTQPGQAPAGTQPAGADGGSQQANGSAQGAPPSWIADILKDEARVKEFATYARSTYQEDFDAHKKESEKRENTWKGHATNSDYWKKLDDASREHVSDAQANLQDAIDTAMEKGVPKELLEDFSTAKAVRAFSTKYLKANGGSKPGASAGAGDDLETRIAARVLEAIKGNAPGAAANGVRKEPMLPTSYNGRRQEGLGNYKERLKSGPMPSADEIDRMTAGYLQ